jgi:phosphate uptake regulator
MARSKDGDSMRSASSKRSSKRVKSARALALTPTAASVLVLTRETLPIDDPRVVRRTKRAIDAMSQTSVRSQFAHIEDILDAYDRSLSEWIGDRDRFDALDADAFKILAYGYGYVMGIADAYHVSITMLARVFEQTCDRCGKHVERLIPVITKAKAIDLCRTCIILGGES